MEISFTKMNGAGNDFVVLDNRDGRYDGLDTAAIARLCDRHRGVGADGLLAVEPVKAGSDADFTFRYYNADGGEAEMCGNGARCFGKFARRLLGNGTPEVSFDTIAGRITARFIGENVRIQLSEPHDFRLGLDLPLPCGQSTVHFVNTGVPHAVLLVEDLETTDVRGLGAALRYHEAFAPRGTNANFQSVLAPGEIAIRTYERGVEDETLACGTGIVANALVHHRLTGAPSPVRVRVRGGDLLEVGFIADGPESFREVTLTGPADFVFTGAITL
jgi:diaminopimelate epimerase